MKSMSSSDRREVFLKYLADIYLQNSDLPILKDTIYYELSRFKISDGKICRLSNDSLVGVQLQLNNKFRNNDKVVTFLSSTGYYWVIQNRVDMSEYDYFKYINNGVKLYVMAKANNIYKIADALFDFMINENIVMECKISKEMRNDALVCRILNKDDAIKICDFLNKLRYKFSSCNNPFMYSYGSVSVALDGNLTYNNILVSLLKIYLEEKRSTNSLEDVSCTDFTSFIREQMKFYENCDDKVYDNNVKIVNLILGNLDDELKLDDFFEIVDEESDAYEKISFSKNDEDKVLYVINSLANYYSVSYVHKIIMNYIETGNVNLFTRCDDIRTIISNNFTKEDVKNIISILGWKALVAASKLTYNKYGTEQLINATDKLLHSEEISGFTRDNDVRSYLGLVIPSMLLREVIENKMEEKSIELTTESLTDLVLDEIEV